MRITPGRREGPELMMKNPSMHGNTPEPTCETTPDRPAMPPVYWCPISCASRASIECAAVSKSERSMCSPSPRSFEPCSATIVARAPTKPPWYPVMRPPVFTGNSSASPAACRLPPIPKIVRSVAS